MSNPHFYVYTSGYKAAPWVKQCLQSVAQQTYTNYTHIIVEDASPDATGKLCDKYAHSRAKVYHATENMGWTANAVKYCKPKDEDIVITLDLDDWLPHEKVFQRIVNIYKKHKCWLTYGNWAPNRAPNQKQTGHMGTPYPEKILEQRTFRKVKFRATHLRTFKGFLWNNIDPETLKDQEGNYGRTTYDIAIMMPMLEMCKPGKIFCTDEILYIYNKGNPLNDQKVFRVLQKQLDSWYRSMPKVEVLDRDSDG